MTGGVAPAGVSSGEGLVTLGINEGPLIGDVRWLYVL